MLAFSSSAHGFDQVELSIVDPSFICGNKSFKTCDIVIVGCPFDGTATFRPGARFGPSAIRRASWGIETFSPYLRLDLDSLRIHDMGDLELPLGDKKESLSIIGKALRKIVSAGKFPVALGGDHLITLPIFEEVVKVYPELHLIHIDAHADLREEYLGETLSHCTVMRRILSRLGKGKFFQIGVRSCTKEEFKLAKNVKALVPFEGKALKSMVRDLKKKPVYISFDIDVMDPGLVPGVGTPEPGGITFKDLSALIRELRPLNVVGLDLVELAPDYDPTQVSSVSASVILRELILAFGRRPGRKIGN